MSIWTYVSGIVVYDYLNIIMLEKSAEASNNDTLGDMYTEHRIHTMQKVFGNNIPEGLAYEAVDPPEEGFREYVSFAGDLRGVGKEGLRDAVVKDIVNWFKEVTGVTGRRLYEKSIGQTVSIRNAVLQMIIGDVCYVWSYRKGYYGETDYKSRLVRRKMWERKSCY